MGDQMRTYRVITPTPDFTGEVGGVHFVRGVAVVEAPPPLSPVRALADDETFTRTQLAEREKIGEHPGYRVMAYFRQAGYIVEDITPDDEPEAEADSVPPEGDEPPAKTSTKATGTKGGAK